jgi:adenylate cyclase
MEPERKLTTILAADVAGYSRLMEADEAATLATLKAYRQMMAEKILPHRGRVVSASGDALLAEFQSVVNAVDCAVRIQRELAERNSALPQARRMPFRIGINLGDVMVEGDDLFGDGVNIAARLEALAEPGGILISGTVFEQVKNKLTLGFDYLGPQAVKNISESVPAYRVVLAGEQEQGVKTPMRSETSSSRHGKTALAADPTARVPPGRRPLRARLYRRAAFAGILIAFLFAINVLSYDGTWWFQWPALGILFVFALRAAWTG